MPGSMVSDPSAFLRPSGGTPPGVGGGMMTGDAGPMAGDPGPSGPPDAGGTPPELAQMGMASALMPQILAQQQTEYYKKVLKQLAGVIRQLMKAQGIGPKPVSMIARAVTGLEAAAHAMDKERPQDAAPVESLLAASMMQNRPPMGGAAVPAGLPVMR